MANQTAPKSTAKKATDEISMNRREKTDRRGDERRKGDGPVAVERRGAERRKVQRRRQIDPTTCERDYSNEEIEFMHAIDLFKRTSGRSFPTCQDVLDVIQRLGYRKVAGV